MDKSESNHVTQYELMIHNIKVSSFDVGPQVAVRILNFHSGNLDSTLGMGTLSCLLIKIQSAPIHG